MRGTLPRADHRRGAARFIPARAGNTAYQHNNPERARVHPRACGEHPSAPWLSSGISGSSPRVRGTPRARGCTAPARRFIPARAGNTQWEAVDHSSAAVHPRACGEHFNHISQDSPERGSSPRVRGTRSPSPRTCAPIPVHPRACGEHLSAVSQERITFGSSPRVRGTPHNHSDGTAGRAVHPRACGEHTSLPLPLAQPNGSSPRVRGTLPSACAGDRTGRFIPARAGNTASRRVSSARKTVHPRACGEHTGHWPLSWGPNGSSPRVRGTLCRRGWCCPARRFIPARAGNTQVAGPGTKAMPVHPRACGEHPIPAPTTTRSAGSSPRVRGTLFLQIADFTMEISLPLRYRSW